MTRVLSCQRLTSTRGQPELSAGSQSGVVSVSTAVFPSRDVCQKQSRLLSPSRSLVATSSVPTPTSTCWSEIRIGHNAKHLESTGSAHWAETLSLGATVWPRVSPSVSAMERTANTWLFISYTQRNFGKYAKLTSNKYHDFRNERKHWD